MKSIINIFGILFAFLLISSCSSSRPIADDDVYMMKTSAVPIGENLMDETSYATFKYREDNNNPTAGYYNPENESLANDNRSFAMSPRLFINYSVMFGMSNSYNHMFYNPYMNSYSYFGSPYWGNSGFGNYYGMNSPYFLSTPAYSTNSSNSGHFYSSGNKVSGPRSTNSGYYSGVSRGGSQQLKSQVKYSGSTNGMNTVSKQTMSRESSARNSYSREKAIYSSSNRVNTNPDARRQNNTNAQTGPKQIRNIPSYVNTNARNTRVINSSTGNQTPRGNSSNSNQTVRSGGNNGSSVPSVRSTTPSAPSGRRK